MFLYPIAFLGFPKCGTKFTGIRQSGTCGKLKIKKRNIEVHLAGYDIFSICSELNNFLFEFTDTYHIPLPIVKTKKRLF